MRCKSNLTLKQRFLFTIVVVSLLSVLTGCIALPGQEPFGERTSSSEQAQTMYKKVASDISQLDASIWDGYTLSVSGSIDDDFSSQDIYKTEEYTLAYHEGYPEEYLWYDGWLYRVEDAQPACRDMAWEEIMTEEYVLDKLAFAQQLLEQEAGELVYKYIPMAEAHPYLLTAKYPEAQMDGKPVCSVKLSVRLKEDGAYDGFDLSWQEKHGKTNRAYAMSFFAYDGSSSLQAERKLWSFGHKLGATAESVPALSDQEENRQQCRQIIANMDFEALRQQSDYQKDLSFPKK